MVTKDHAIEYFVKSSHFDHQFPQGSTAQSTVENSILQTISVYSIDIVAWNCKEGIG